MLKETSYTNEEKIDAMEVAEEVKKLPAKEKEKIFYMIKGAALVSGTSEEKEDQEKKEEERKAM